MSFKASCFLKSKETRKEKKEKVQENFFFLFKHKHVLFTPTLVVSSEARKHGRRKKEEKVQEILQEWIYEVVKGQRNERGMN